MERLSRIASRSKRFGNAPNNDALVAAAWAVAIGKRLAKRDFPLHLYGTKLVVDVDDKVWQRQMSGLSEMILDRLNQALSKPLVQQLEFRIVGAKPEGPRKPIAAEVPRDEADAIADPVLRGLYRSARRRETA